MRGPGAVKNGQDLKLGPGEMGNGSGGTMGKHSKTMWY